MSKLLILIILFSSCYSPKSLVDREYFIKSRIDIKQKYIKGEITKCEYDWLMLTNYEMYYGQ